MAGKLAPWRTLSSRIIVEDQWLRLRADTCETAEGVRIDPFYVIETAGVVAIAAVTVADELVLVRQYRHGFGGVTLELPAGRIDTDEAPLTAAMRELREETGYGGGEASVLRSFSPNTLRYSNRMHAVLIAGVSLEAAPDNDPTEHIETVLWPMGQALDLLDEPEFVHSGFAGVLALALRTYGAI